jgi:hypothetical protein
MPGVGTTLPNCRCIICVLLVTIASSSSVSGVVIAVGMVLAYMQAVRVSDDSERRNDIPRVDMRGMPNLFFHGPSLLVCLELLTQFPVFRIRLYQANPSTQPRR